MDPSATGLCTHELASIDDAIVSVLLGPTTPGVEVYARDKRMTAATARQLAHSILRAADLVDGLALPEGEGRTVGVANVAMLANVSEHEVRDAITSGDLAAFPAVDGSKGLVIRYTDAMAWALEQRDHQDEGESL